MTKIRIEIEVEQSSWYATSPDIAGFNAFGNSLEEVRELAEGLIYFYFEGENIQVNDLVIEENIIERTQA
jgi:predicted RNase H-like HicB family nuclease